MDLVAAHRRLALVARQRLVLQQRIGQADEFLVVLGQDLARAFIGGVDEALDLGVDGLGGRLRDVLLATHAHAEEHFLVVLAVGHRAELVGIAKARDHRAGKPRRLLDVARCTRRDVLLAERDLLGHAAAHGDRQLRGELDVFHRVAVTFGQELDHAERSAARNDRRLVHGDARRHVHADDGVARLVERGQALFFLAHRHRLALGAHHHLVLGVFELGHGDDALVAPGGQQGRLVDEVGEIGAREAGRAAGDDLGIDIGCQRHLVHVDFEDLLAAQHVGVRHHDLAVEAARTQQRGIEHVRPVGRGDQDDAFVGFEAVHLDEQLVQRLLALVVAAAKAGAAVTAHGVDFVDEDDARRILLRLLEHVAHAAGADADEHLDEVRAGDREERHVGFASDGAGEQRLTGARRADQQHAARDAAAKALELLRIAKEVDDLFEVRLGFVDAGHIVEGDAAVTLGQQLGAALTKAHRAAGARLHLAHEEDPDADQQQHREPVDERAHQRRQFFLRWAELELDLFLAKAVDKAVVLSLQGRERLGAFLHLAVDAVPRNLDLSDVPGSDLVQKLRVADLIAAVGARRGVEDVEQSCRQDDQSDPYGQLLDMRVHLCVLSAPRVIVRCSGAWRSWPGRRSRNCRERK